MQSSEPKGGCHGIELTGGNEPKGNRRSFRLAVRIVRMTVRGGLRESAVLAKKSAVGKSQAGITAEQQPQMPFDSPAAPTRSGQALPTRCATPQDDRREQRWLAARYRLRLPAGVKRHRLFATSRLFLWQPHHELRPPRL